MVTPAQGGPCGWAPGKEKLEGRRRDAHQRWHQYTRQPGENTHYCHSGATNGNVLDERGFLIIHANSRSHSEFSPKRTGQFFCFFVEKTHSKCLEVALLSQRMLSQDCINIQLTREITLRILSLTLSDKNLCYCSRWIRRTGMSLKGKRGAVCVFVIVWARRQGSVEAGSRCGWLMVAVWMENFSGSAPVNWWELMQ